MLQQPCPRNLAGVSSPALYRRLTSGGEFQARQALPAALGGRVRAWLKVTALVMGGEQMSRWQR
jgi:hypothetical protein